VRRHHGHEQVDVAAAQHGARVHQLPRLGHDVGDVEARRAIDRDGAERLLLRVFQQRLAHGVQALEGLAHDAAVHLADGHHEPHRPVVAATDGGAVRGAVVFHPGGGGQVLGLAGHAHTGARDRQAHLHPLRRRGETPLTPPPL
jgi:hypothetical protein